MTVKNLEAVLGINTNLPHPRFKRTARGSAIAALRKVDEGQGDIRAAEAAEQEQRRRDALQWQLTFNRLYPQQAVPV